MPFTKGDGTTHARVANPLADDEFSYLRTSILDTLARLRRIQSQSARRKRSLALSRSDLVFNQEGERRCRVKMSMWPHSSWVRGGPCTSPGSENHRRSMRGMPRRSRREDCTRGVSRRGHFAEREASTAVFSGSFAPRGSASLGSVRAVPLDAPVWASPAFGGLRSHARRNVICEGCARRQARLRRCGSGRSGELRVIHAAPNHSCGGVRSRADRAE